MILETSESTIVAIATPPGEGGVAILRISGPQALEIGSRLFSKKLHILPSHTIHFGKIKSENGDMIDEVLLLLMRGPKTFTGEDVVEIHCHGGRLVSKMILERALKEGAALAAPGQFTERAFLNGKIDLTKAEAIQSLISAKNEHAVKAAQMHLEGTLFKKISSLKEGLTGIAAIFEAWVDFPEEGLEFASPEEVLEEMHLALLEMKKLLSSADRGRMIKEGIKIALIGAPNVGKSSLLNALLKEERAIVSPYAGTTRDTVDAELMMGGIHVLLTDTAGIREAPEEIEKEGIRRSKLALDKADLVLFLADAEKGWGQEEDEILSLLPKQRTLLVWNKIDRPHHPPPEHLPHVSISAKVGTAVDTLKRKIEELIFQDGGPSEEGLLLTEVRQKMALEEAATLLEKVIEGQTANISPEFLVFDLRASLKALGKIIGSDIQEDILSAIFSRFCIGK